MESLHKFYILLLLKSGARRKVENLESTIMKQRRDREREREGEKELLKMYWEGLQEIIQSIPCPKAGSTCKYADFDRCLSNSFLKVSNTEEFATLTRCYTPSLIICRAFNQFQSLI